MANEKLVLTLGIAAYDVNGTPYNPANLVAQYLSQTKLVGPREFNIAPAATVDIWDPTTWTGYPLTAFQGAVLAIQDVGAVTPASSVQKLEVELISHLVAAQGFIITIPPGGFFVVPNAASYYTPNAQNDQWTGATAGVINRIRVKNPGATVTVKLTTWMVDNS